MQKQKGSKTPKRGRRTRERRAVALVVAGILARRIVRAQRRIEFRGRTVVITGGSRGLGLLLAREFASEGATLAICARDEAELATAKEELTSRGARVHSYVCDVANADQVRRVLQSVELEVGPIDVLVNNAGIIEVGPAESMSVEDYAAAMRAHFWGPLYAIDAVLPAMRDRRFGRIVNIASIGGKVSVPHLLPYNASKFALVGLSEGLRAEMARYNVLVTTICPGLMRTGSPRHAEVKGRHQAEYAWFAISDSLPGLSMDAVRAARRIVEACRFGEAEVVIGTPARIAARIHGLWPGVTADALGWLTRLLPGPGDNGSTPQSGAESSSALAPSVLTAASDRAAARNNEVRV